MITFVLGLALIWAIRNAILPLPPLEQAKVFFSMVGLIFLIYLSATGQV